MVPPQEFWQGIEEFNQQEFYACHDTLEALWMDASALHKSFYQGILQIAVACYHLSNYNWRGAVTLLGEGTRRISEYPTDYGNINVTALLDESLLLLESLQKIEPTKVAEFVEQGNYQLPKIHKIES